MRPAATRSLEGVSACATDARPANSINVRSAGLRSVMLSASPAPWVMARRCAPRQLWLFRRRKRLIAEGRGRRRLNGDEATLHLLMAGVAAILQFADRFHKPLAVPGLDRVGNRLHGLCHGGDVGRGNALIQYRRFHQTGLELAKFVNCELPVQR